MKNNRILFICKKRCTYGVSYGLLNSCRFLVNALADMGCEAKIVEVTDNNDIDREVNIYKATHVFIEALWVVPSKFDELIPMYPQVKWYVRLHSNTPFISQEGMAIEWIVKYFALGVKYRQFKVAPNSQRMCDDLEDCLGARSVYAPNIYMPTIEDGMPPRIDPFPPTPSDKHIDVGCFGAIRPLKNQLIQAVAAIALANQLDKQMTFHINSTRVEQYGQPILRNLEALFSSTRHTLAVHDWLDHPNFMDLVRTMDLGLQVSFSETFNIVAADFVYANIPLVGSTEIEWLSSFYKAKPTEVDDIVAKLQYAWQGRKFNTQVANRYGLHEWNVSARKAWKRLLNG